MASLLKKVKAKLKDVRVDVQSSRAAGVVARGLLYGGTAAGALIGGTAGAAIGGAAGTAAGSVLRPPDKRKAFVRRGLTVAAGATVATGGLGLLSGAGLGASPVTSLGSLFGGSAKAAGVPAGAEGAGIAQGIARVQPNPNEQSGLFGSLGGLLGGGSRQGPPGAGEGTAGVTAGLASLLGENSEGGGMSPLLLGALAVGAIYLLKKGA